MPVKHAFVSGVSDGPEDPAIVRPSDWNANHLSIPFPVHIICDDQELSWSPSSSLVEFLGGTWARAINRDFAHIAQVRIQAYIKSTASTAEWRWQYSLDNGSSWSYIDHGTGPNIDVSTAGQKFGSWVDVHSTLRSATPADVRLRLVSSGGNSGAINLVSGVTLWGR